MTETIKIDTLSIEYIDGDFESHTKSDTTKILIEKIENFISIDSETENELITTLIPIHNVKKMKIHKQKEKPIQPIQTEW